MNLIEEFEESLIDMSENTKKAYVMDVYTILREKFYHFWDFPNKYKEAHLLLKETFNHNSIDDVVKSDDFQIIESKKSYLIPINDIDKENINKVINIIGSDKDFWNYFFERKSVMKVLNHLYQHHNLNTNTIRRKMSAMSKAEDFFWINEFIDKKEVHGIPMPKIKRKEPNPLTKNQVNKLLNMPLTKKFGSKNGLRDKALLELLYGTGIRVSAVCNLKWKDVNIDGNYIIISLKGGNQVTKPLTNPIVKWLKEYHSTRGNVSSYVFPGRNGNMIERRSIRKIVKSYGSKLGVDISPHTLRSSLATHIAENGGDQFDVQQQLDHAHPITSESYVRVGKKLRQPMKYHPRK